MMKYLRIILCIGMASLMLICLADFCLAKSDQINELDERTQEPISKQMTDHHMRGPIEVLHSGCGFALKDNESYVLRINVESLWPIDPGQIRKQLSSNKSIEEIKNDILAKIGETTYRGNLMLQRNVYTLTNIKVNSIGNSSTSIEADITDLDVTSPSDETTKIGSMSIIITPTDDRQVGKGNIELNHGNQKGKYAALLDMQPPRGGNCPMP